MASSAGLSVRSVQSFYEFKSVIPSFKFDVMLNFDRYSTNNPELGLAMLSVYDIKPYHILSVDLPLNTFNRENTNIGSLQYSYPVLSKEQPLDIKITFEEDQNGTIGWLIQDLQESVIRDGLHVCPKKSRLGDIHINFNNMQDNAVNSFIAKDVFFLGATGGNHTYDSNDSVKYDITFGTDVILYNDTPLQMGISGKRINLKPSGTLG